VTAVIPPVVEKLFKTWIPQEALPEPPEQFWKVMRPKVPVVQELEI
jgi:hypothetical protein